MDAGEFGVEAVLREEGVVCAAFDDGALLKHENLVGLTNGAEAVAITKLVRPCIRRSRAF